MKWSTFLCATLYCESFIMIAVTVYPVILLTDETDKPTNKPTNTHQYESDITAAR